MTPPETDPSPGPDAGTDATPPSASPTGRQRAAAAWRELQQSVLWKMLSGQRRWLIGVVGASLLQGGSFIGFVIALKDIFDEVLITHAKPLDPYLAKLWFFALGVFIWGLANRLMATRLVYQLEYDLRVWLYERLQEIAPDALDGLSAGQLLTRALTDLAFLEAFTVVVPIILGGVILVVGLAGLMLALSPLLGLVALITIPINTVVVKRMGRRLWGLSWLTLSTRAEVTAAIDEPVRGIRVIKAFGAEDAARSSLADRAGAAYGVSMARVRLLARYGILTKAVPIVATSVLLYFGAKEALAGHFTIGSLVVFLGFGAVFTGIAGQLDEFLSGALFASTGSTRIFELVALPAAPTTGGSLNLPDARTTGLTAHAVRTPHGPEPFDLAIGPGEWLALTGPPASGSSALARAVSGLAPLADGTVLIDGVPLADVEPTERRRAVKHVGSEPFLFGRTIRENLLVGAHGDHASDERLWDALTAAGADGFVRDLGGGLDATIGDRGLTLSGGQRQRLALARALVVEPRLLVLDDALTAVNPSLEAEILAAARRFVPRAAVLLVSRRPGPLSVADTVVELPARVDLGADAELLAASPQFDDPRDEELVRAILEAGPTEERPSIPEHLVVQTPVPRVGNLLSPMKRLVAAGVAVLLVQTVLGFAPDALTRWTVDGVRDHDVHPAAMSALILVGISVVLAVITYVLRIVVRKVNEAVLYLLRRRAFHRLTRLGIDYYDRELPGQVASRVVYDLDKITEFIETGVYPLVVAVALLLVAFGLLFIVSAKAFAAALPFVVVMVPFTLVEIPIAARAYDRVRDKLGKVIERFHEDFTGRHVIAGFGGQEHARSGFAAASWELRQSRRWATGVSNVYLSLIDGFTLFASAAMIGVATRQALSGELTVGSVVFLELLMLRALAPIPTLSGVIQTYLTARSSFRTLRQPFQAAIVPDERADAAECPPLSGHLTFEDVTFTYPQTDHHALRQVSLDVAAGEVIALVGPTGAGKSSLAKMLARVYDPDGGRVLVDGQDVRGFELTSYRRRLGVVPQDAFCFRGTVGTNIAFGRPAASRREIGAAVEATGVRDILLSLPHGLDTPVDEEGRNLSPVARQAIAIARAWLVEPDVLVLDEATSNLPDAVEQDVLDAVRRLGRTAVVVTHRLSVAAHVDRVAVVDGGQIVEVGTHDELITAGGAYEHLWHHGADGAMAGAAATPAPPGARRRRTRR